MTVDISKHRHNKEIIKTVWQEQKGSRSCSYIRHKKLKKTKKSAHKHKINNEKWNTYTLTPSHTHTHKKTYIKTAMMNSRLIRDLARA